MKTKKKIITLSLLLVVLALLIAGFFIIKAVLANDEQGPSSAVKPEKGEGVMGNALTIFPEIPESNIYSIDIKHKNGHEYGFVKTWDKDKAKYVMSLKNYEKLPYDEEAYAYLTAYVRCPITYEPIRNATNEQLSEYGVTQNTCRFSFTIISDEETGKREYTVYVGNEAYSAGTTYYASVEGRNVIYRLQKDIDTYASKTLYDYLSPTIFERFKNATDAILGIESFDILKTKLQENSASSVISLRVSEKTETSAYFDAIYNIDKAGRQKITFADSSYLLDVFGLLYGSFKGESVVAINPNDEELKKYGLGEGFEQYMVVAVHGENDTTRFLFSDEIDGYYYTLSTYSDPKIPLLIKISADKLSFLKSDEASLLKWSATNSVLTSFFEYLLPDDEAGEPGIKELTIRTKDYKETFYVNYNKGTKHLEMTTKDSGLVFGDVDTDDPYEKNQFRNLFTYLVYYPMPKRFNYMTDSELAEIMLDENIVYELDVVRNDGVLLKYTYYRITASYALQVMSEGKIVDGNKVWQEPTINFDVTMEHIEKISEAYKTIMEGGKIKPDDNIY